MKKTIVLLTTISLTSCAALDATINHNNLEVNSKTSDTIFLEPMSANKQIVYVSVKNTTDQDMRGLGATIKKNFTTAGWKLTNDPHKAYNMVQVNVLQIGQAKDRNSVWSSLLNGGFGSVLAGGLAGTAVGYLSNSSGAGLGVGLLVGAGSWVADKLVKDVVYSVITDVEVLVKGKGRVNHTTLSKFSQGNSSVEYQHHYKQNDWQKFRTRIASVADKVNLKFAEAKPKLVEQQAHQISSIFLSED